MQNIPQDTTSTRNFELPRLSCIIRYPAAASTPPPRRSSAATYPRGRPRGETISAALSTSAAALPSPRTFVRDDAPRVRPRMAWRVRGGGPPLRLPSVLLVRVDTSLQLSRGALIPLAVPRPPQRYPPAAGRPVRRASRVRGNGPPLPLPSAPLVCGDTRSRLSARGADPRGRPAAAAATSPRGRPAGRVRSQRQASAPPPLPSSPLVRGDTPPRPSARGANLRGRPAAASTSPPHRLSAVTCRAGRRSPRLFHDLRSDVLPRPFARGADLRSGKSLLPLPSPSLVYGDTPARLSARADIFRGLRGGRPRSPSRRSSAVMLPRGYPPGALMSATTAGLRSPSPFIVRGSLQSSRGRGSGGGPPLPLPTDCPRV